MPDSPPKIPPGASRLQLLVSRGEITELPLIEQLSPPTWARSPFNYVIINNDELPNSEAHKLLYNNASCT